MSKYPKSITAAKKLLESNGYEVKMKRPDPKIGDVVRFDTDEDGICDVLITFHQTDDTTIDDVYDFGGVVVSEGRWDDLNTDAHWIDREEWAKDDGQYTIVGHVDLSKYTKTVK